MTREEAIQKIEEIRKAADRWSLSDEFLEETKCNRTRKDIGVGGEFSYGIFMVPEKLVFDIVAALTKG